MSQAGLQARAGSPDPSRGAERDKVSEVYPSGFHRRDRQHEYRWRSTHSMGGCAGSTSVRLYRILLAATTHEPADTYTVGSFSLARALRESASSKRKSPGYRLIRLSASAESSMSRPRTDRGIKRGLLLLDATLKRNCSLTCWAQTRGGHAQRSAVQQTLCMSLTTESAVTLDPPGRGGDVSG